MLIYLVSRKNKKKEVKITITTLPRDNILVTIVKIMLHNKQPHNLVAFSSKHLFLMYLWVVWAWLGSLSSNCRTGCVSLLLWERLWSCSMGASFWGPEWRDSKHLGKTFLMILTDARDWAQACKHMAKLKVKGQGNTVGPPWV